MALNKIPGRQLTLALMCILLPVVLETFLLDIMEAIWFLHLIAIFFFTYYLSTFFAFLLVISTICLHIIWELIEHLVEGFSTYRDLEVLMFLSLLKLLLFFGLKYLLREGERRQQELEEANKKLKHLAQHDSLTHLPNRYFINEYLAKAINRCIENKKRLAVIFMDIDNFKLVNDRYGHDVGDKLLKEVAKGILTCIRAQDIFARQGGDEFILLLEDVSEKEVVGITERIMKKFSAPFLIDGIEIYSSTSIGISFYPEDGRDAPTLIKNADLAMYEVKRQGGGGSQFFSRQKENK